MENSIQKTLAKIRKNVIAEIVFTAVVLLLCFIYFSLRKSLIPLTLLVGLTIATFPAHIWLLINLKKLGVNALRSFIHTYQISLFSALPLVTFGVLYSLGVTSLVVHAIALLLLVPYIYLSLRYIEYLYGTHLRVLESTETTQP